MSRRKKKHRGNFFFFSHKWKIKQKAPTWTTKLILLLSESEGRTRRIKTWRSLFFFFFKIASVEAFRAANCSAHGWFGDMALRSSPCWREERERESISGITLYLNVKRSDPHPLHRCNMWTVNDESEVVKRGFDSVFTLCIHKRPFCVIPCCWKKNTCNHK